VLMLPRCSNVAHNVLVIVPLLDIAPADFNLAGG
jgi:hypothetical protein